MCSLEWKHCLRCVSLGRRGWYHISDFYEDKRGPGRYRPNCKQCERDKRKEYYINNKDKELEKIKNYNKENKDIIRAYERKYKRRRRKRRDL